MFVDLKISALIILVLPRRGYLETLDGIHSVPTPYTQADGALEGAGSGGGDGQGDVGSVSITIGHQSPYPDHPISLMALERGISRYLSEGRRPKLNISVLYATDGRNPKKTTSSAVKMTQKGVAAILGNYFSNAGYYLSAENLVSWPSGCSHVTLTDKNVFNTVVRVYPSGTTVGPAFLKIFQHYKWTSAVIWSVGWNTCEFGSVSITKHFRENNITVAEWIRTSEHVLTFSDREMDDFLARMKSRGRVFILCHGDEHIRKLMMRAHKNGMTGNDFVYLLFSLQPPLYTFLDSPWLTGGNQTDAEVAESKKAFYAMKEVTIADMTDTSTRYYVDRIRAEANQRWNISYTEPIHVTIMYLEDLTYLYLSVVGDILQEGGTRKDFLNGTYVSERARKITFSGATGQVILNDNGDRSPEFWILQYTGGDKYKPYAYVRHLSTTGKYIDELEQPYWRTPDGRPPPDVPLCGLNSEKCPVDHSTRNTAIGSCFGIVFASTVFAIILYTKIRKKKQEEELQRMIWRVSYEDLQFTKNRVGSVSAMSLRTAGSEHPENSADCNSLPGAGHTQLYTKTAFYKDILVAVKTYTVRERLDLTRSDLVQLKVMKEMSHDNVNPFAGACIDLPRVCTLGHYCTRGSLQDILENEEVKLDWMFKSSLVNDIVNGMCYLHDSPLISHGCLKSSNCLVDSRWILKLSNFGLTAFKTKRLKEQQSEYAQYRKQLWTAPELLQCERPPLAGTPAGDVYSFAIILQEILYRAMPYFAEPGILTPKDIIGKLRETGGGTFRPCLPNDYSCHDKNLLAINAAKTLMQTCWVQEPGNRPTFKQIKYTLRKMNQGKALNIVESMINKLEKYAGNLEDIVAQRTSALIDEKKKTDSLLYRMLPPSVADKLKKGQLVEPELCDEVSICFSDIVGFTSLSSESTPMEIVNLLNDLYTAFDGTIATHDVYKVETIGDAYMVVSGLPKKNGSRHIAEIAHMALDLLSEITTFKIRHRPEEKLKLRVGIHTGGCAAGVVGLAMPRYCLFGDTVNVASRMESNGEGLRIHLSSDAQAALSKYPEYHTVERGQIPIKGKGNVLTYWLIGKENFHKPLPKMA